MSSKSTLIRLIQNNPDLEVLVLVNNKVCNGEDYGWSFGKLSQRYAYIGEVYKGKKQYYLKDEDEPFEIFEIENDINYTNDEVYEEACMKFCRDIRDKWEKVIITFVDTLEEE